MSEEKEKPHIPLHRERMGLPDNEEQKKLREQKRKQLRLDCQETFNSPSARRVLRYLMDITGYRKGVIGGNPALGLDVIHGTFYNAIRLQIMIELLEFIPADIQKDCEFGVVSDLEN